MKHQSLFVLFFILVTGCSGGAPQTTAQPVSTPTDTGKVVGGGCDGCELMYIGMPAAIAPESTSPGWTEGKRRLLITGKILQRDGKTPAPGVIVYYWHTDDQGRYSAKPSTPKAAAVHGHLRGWVQADREGNYTIRTSRPAHYPDEEMAAHIHLSIKEPTIQNEYYADLYFKDDPKYLKHQKKYGTADRAGAEVLSVVLKDNIQVAVHNIICGLNIPGYPAASLPD